MRSLKLHQSNFITQKLLFKLPDPLLVSILRSGKLHMVSTVSILVASVAEAVHIFFSIVVLILIGSLDLQK